MFTISPSDEDLQRGLQAWSWLGVDGLTPILVSSFGDVFFESASGIEFLDTIEGSIRHVCAGRSALHKHLSTEEARDDFLLGSLVISLKQRKNLHLSAGECYDFKLPPVLGGTVDIENIHAINFVVKLHVAGQLHEQLRNVPEGTRISGFTFQDG